MMSWITSLAVNVSFSILLSDERSFYLSWRTFLDARLNEELGHFLIPARRFAYMAMACEVGEHAYGGFDRPA